MKKSRNRRRLMNKRDKKRRSKRGEWKRGMTGGERVAEEKEREDGEEGE